MLGPEVKIQILFSFFDKKMAYKFWLVIEINILDPFERNISYDAIFNDFIIYFLSCIFVPNDLFAAFWSTEIISLLKEFSHGILSYFCHMQNYLYIEGNLKIVVY